MAMINKWTIIAAVLLILYFTNGLSIFENPIVLIFGGLFLAVIAFSR